MNSGNFYVLWLPGVTALLALLAVCWRKRAIAVPLEVAPSPVSPGDVVTILLVAVVLAIAVIPSARWGFSDDDVFVLSYLRGRPYPPPIWPDSGRFFPLGHQEWRLFYTWTDSIRVFYLSGIIQYACYCLGVVLLLKELKCTSRLVPLFIITLPPVLVAFSNLVVPERSQLMFLPWLLLFLLRWDRTGLYRYVFLALLCAQFMLYVKEPTVLFIMSLAALRLLGPLRKALSAIAIKEWLELRRLIRLSIADVGLILSGLIFLGLYFSAVPFGTLFSSQRVYDRRSLEATHVLPSLEAWATKEPLLITMLALGLMRVVVGIVRRKSIDTTDAMLVAAALYFASLVSSSLVSTFYGALPMAAAAIAITVPLGRGAPEDKRQPQAQVFVALVGLGVLFNLFLFAPRLLYEHDWTRRNAELTSNLEQMLAGSPGPRRVFLTGHSWDAEMLAVYADGLRKLDITFVIGDARYIGNQEGVAADCNSASYSCLAYSAQPSNGQLVVDLGKLESSRSAHVWRDGQFLWGYDDEDLGRLMSITPGLLRGVVRDAYNFW